MALMYAVKSIKGSWGLRLAPEAELEGIDIFAHGLPAYHMEFGQGFSYTMPTGGSGSFDDDRAKVPESTSAATAGSQPSPG